MTRVLVIVMRTNSRVNQILASAFVKKKKRLKAWILEPKQRLEEQEKATVVHEFTVLGSWLRKDFCLTHAHQTVATEPEQAPDRCQVYTSVAIKAMP